MEIISHICSENLFCDPSLESSHGESSNKASQYMFSLRVRKIIFELSPIPPLIWMSDNIDIYKAPDKKRLTENLLIFSSPEHEVLMVSYCDQSMSVVRRQQFVLNANSS